MVLPNGQFRVVFWPKDYDASVRFYRDGLGLSIDHEWDYGEGDKGVVFYAGPAMIELLGLAPGAAYVPPQGASLLIQVDDADRWYGLAQARGFKVLQPPTTFPWGHRIVRVADPDGLVISLFHPVTVGG